MSSGTSALEPGAGGLARFDALPPPVGVWQRLRRDRVAVASLSFLVFVLFACFVGEPIAAHFLGHGPSDFFPYGAGIDLKPVEPWSWVPDQNGVYPRPTADTPHTFFLLGADGPLGRDEFLRLLAGGQVSLEIGFGAAVIALLIGVTLGALAGYFGGFVDGLVSRSTELFMGFPLLLLLIAMGQTISDRLDFITLGGVLGQGALSLSLVIGVFTWFYPARIVRSLVLTLRETEFIEAARMIGAGDLRIIRTHVLPHLAGPIVVWGTLIMATNIVLEAAISFLNLGVRLPNPSWGNMLSSNWGTLLAFNPAPVNAVRSDWPMVWPTAAVLLTVLALSLLGEALRSIIDPRAVD